MLRGKLGYLNRNLLVTFFVACLIGNGTPILQNLKLSKKKGGKYRLELDQHKILV